MKLSEVIKLNTDNCVNCHQCISVCPVKYCNDGSGDYVTLNAELCIGCGECIKACEHNARSIIDDFDKFIADIRAGKKIVAVVAPAIAAQFENSYLNFNGWLKSIGVKAVFDVSFGAELTVKTYLEHVKKNNPECVIAQPCPAIVTYIEIYKPELLKYLAPADSPMMHTMKMIKNYYTEFANHKFAIISPCIAKKREFDEVGIGDYNVTMKSIQDYFVQQNIRVSAFPETDYNNPPAERAVLFSTPGGLMRTATRENKAIPNVTRKIEGPGLIYHYLNDLEKNIKNGKAPLLIDCLNCEFGCNGGTGTSGGKTVDELEYSVEKRNIEMQKKYKKTFSGKTSLSKIRKTINKYWDGNLYGRSYKDHSEKFRTIIKIPGNDELQKVYTLMLKSDEKDIRNCAACGFDSCEKMAISIFNGLNKPENCHLYLEKTEKEIERNLPVVREFANGNLTVHFETSGKGETAKLFNELNNTVAKIRAMMNEVGMLIKSTVNSSYEICDQTDEISRGINDQSQKTSEMAASIEQLVTTINETTVNSNKAAENAKKSLEVAGSGGDIIQITIDSMKRIGSVIENSAVTVNSLGSRSHEISEIIAVINEIADQTNLLALNAAIEAARAGEQGRGFAVVADEVRKLADKTTKATKEIAQMIQKIQEASEETVRVIGNGKEIIESGINSAEESGSSLNEIINGTKNTLDITNQVAAANEEESAAVDEISKNIEVISDVSHNTVNTVTQVKDSVERLRRLTMDLERSFLQFKIEFDESEANSTKIIRKESWISNN